MTLLGREPAAWAGMIQAIVAILTATWLDWDVEQVGAVNACVAAVLGTYVAWATSRTMLGVITTLVNTVLALLVAFKFDMPERLSIAVLAAVPIMVGFFQRTQVSPLDRGNFDLRT